MFEDGYREEMLRVRPDELQMERLLAQIRGAKGTRCRRTVRTVLVAAALCVLCGLSALALSPSLRELLAQSMGAFAPYSQAVEGVRVENGIEIKVISALADGSMVRVYAEARDLEGDRLSGNLGVWGTVDRDSPEDSRWEGSSTSGGGTCIGYDEETKTALLEFYTWGAVTSDLKDARLVVLGLYPDRNDWKEEMGEDTWYVPLTIESLPEREIPLKDTVWAAQLRKAVISPLGITIHYGGKATISTTEFAVKLADGTFLHPEYGGGGGDGWGRSFVTQTGADNPDPIERMCFTFDDPAISGQVVGVALGHWFIPFEGDVAGDGYWLPELP